MKTSLNAVEFINLIWYDLYKAIFGLDGDSMKKYGDLATENPELAKEWHPIKNCRYYLKKQL